MTPSLRLVLVCENGERLGNQAKILDESKILGNSPSLRKHEVSIHRLVSGSLQSLYLSLLHPKTFWDNYVS